MKKIPQPSDRPVRDVPEDVAASASAPDASDDRPGSADAAGASALDRVRAALDSADDAGAVNAEEPGVARAGADGAGRTRHRSRASEPRGAKKPSRGPARRFARERALQALYQWDMAGAESSTVRREFIERQDMSRVDVDYFERLFRGVSHDVEKVDAALAEALDRPLVEVDPIERAILRIAAFELAEVLETPARVVINEGVEITKRFGADNGHRYVNGVLDGLAAVLRPLEMRRG